MLFFLLRFQVQQFLGVYHRFEVPVTCHFALVAKVGRFGVFALARRRMLTPRMMGFDSSTTWI
jgi:hypothetical protein